jgi:signal transduction histidine kinase
LAIDELLRMHELAERMLDLYRPRNAESGHCAVADVAREVAMLAGVGAEDAVSVFVHTEGQPVAAVPPDALKQVLLNLVQNAREAVPSGLVVRIDVRTELASTAITVCDNGPGVPPGIRGRIFDPFFTTRGSAGGIGLGLFVVEGVVRGYGGRVWLTEAESGGACFHIVLPNGIVEPDAHAAKQAAPTEAKT